MSSLLNYDKAVYKKIKNLYPEVIFAAPENVFSENAKAHDGKVLLPFFGIWRLPDFTVNRDLYNDSYVRRGQARMSRGSDIEYPNQPVAMHGLPVSLQYQVDIYAHKRDVCDGLAAELLLEIYENPWVDVHQTDMGDFMQQFNIDIDDNIVDNTSISEFSETNRFYRLTATLNMASAVIYRISNVHMLDKIEVSLDDIYGEESL